MTDQDTDILIASAASGDDESFCALAEAFEPMVRRFIVARCSYWSSVDDLVQKVFVYLHEHLSDYQSGTDFTAWVLSISRVVMLQKIRREQRRAEAHGRYVASILATHDAERCEDEHVETKLSALQECIGELKHGHRQLVEMQYHGRMSLEQISVKLGKTLSWVKVTLFRIKKALSDCVRKRLPAEAMVK